MSVFARLGSDNVVMENLRNVLYITKEPDTQTTSGK